MHVLIIPSVGYLPPENPLSGIFQYHQANALHRAGVKVGVVSPAPRSLRFLRSGLGKRSQEDKNKVNQDIPVYRYKGWNWTTGRVPYISLLYWNLIAHALYNQYVLNHGVPDLIHAHNALYAGAFAAGLSKKHQIPMILTEHSSMYWLGQTRKWQKPQIRLALKTAKARLVVSPKLGELLEAMFGQDALPWEWVPNLLDESFETMELVPKKSNQNKSFQILNVGSLKEVKNQSLLLRAFAEAFGNNPAVSLRIGGDGSLRHGLERLASQLGVAGQATFLGSLGREQVLNEMVSCDVFVLSSNYETFGVVLIEATACGKPVIATSGSGPDYIVKSLNGVLVPPQDVTSLSIALQEMQAHIGHYDPVLIREDCLSRFGGQAVTGQLITIYKKVLKDRSNLNFF